MVYLLLNAHDVDWYDLYPPRLEAALAGAAVAQAKLAYHDNVYMYGYATMANTEDLDYAAISHKGKLRGEIANRVLAAHQSGEVKAHIGQTADMYGPGALNSAFNSTLGQRHFYPALAGNTVNILGDIDIPHTYAYTEDVAAGLIALAEQDAALGEVWHLLAAPTLSHHQLMTIVFDEAGQPLKVRGSKISGYFVRVIGLFQPDVREVAEMLYQFEKPLVVDHDKFERVFFYLLSIPAVIVSIVMLKTGKPYSFWLAGFIFLVWAVFGLVIEYGFGIQWRNPIVWPVFVPYVVLYLGTIMFYWFPLVILSRPLWYIYAVLLAVTTYLNVTTH